MIKEDVSDQQLQPTNAVSSSETQEADDKLSISDESHKTTVIIIPETTTEVLSSLGYSKPNSITEVITLNSARLPSRKPSFTTLIRTPSTTSKNQRIVSTSKL